MCRRHYAHILREVSACLLVLLRWAHARASNRGASNRYGSHAFVRKPVRSQRGEPGGSLKSMKNFTFGRCVISFFLIFAVSVSAYAFRAEGYEWEIIGDGVVRCDGFVWGILKNS